MKKKNDWIKKGILIIVLLVCIAAYLWVPGIHKTMSRIFKMFASGDFTVWMVERCDPFMEQCNGGSSSMLLYCKNIRT